MDVNDDQIFCTSFQDTKEREEDEKVKNELRKAVQHPDRGKILGITSFREKIRERNIWSISNYSINSIRQRCLEKTFKERYEEVNFGSALAALDSLRVLEYARRQCLREAAGRLNLTCYNWRKILAKDPNALDWIEDMEKAELEVEILYARVTVDLRVWVSKFFILSKSHLNVLQTLVTEFDAIHFSKPRAIAILNTLFPPYFEDIPNARVSKKVIYAHRETFYRHIIAVEARGNSALCGMKNRLEADPRTNWPAVRKNLEDYINLAETMIRKAKAVYGIGFFREQLDEYGQPKEKIWGYSTFEEDSTSDEDCNSYESSSSDEDPSSPRLRKPLAKVLSFISTRTRSTSDLPKSAEQKSPAKPTETPIQVYSSVLKSQQPLAKGLAFATPRARSNTNPSGTVDKTSPEQLIDESFQCETVVAPSPHEVVEKDFSRMSIGSWSSPKSPELSSKGSLEKFPEFLSSKQTPNLTSKSFDGMPILQEQPQQPLESSIEEYLQSPSPPKAAGQSLNASLNKFLTPALTHRPTPVGLYQNSLRDQPEVHFRPLTEAASNYDFNKPRPPPAFPPDYKAPLGQFISQYGSHFSDRRIPGRKMAPPRTFFHHGGNAVEAGVGVSTYGLRMECTRVTTHEPLCYGDLNKQEREKAAEEREAFNPVELATARMKPRQHQRPLSVREQFPTVPFDKLDIANTNSHKKSVRPILHIETGFINSTIEGKSLKEQFEAARRPKSTEKPLEQLSHQRTNSFDAHLQRDRERFEQKQITQPQSGLSAIGGEHFTEQQDRDLMRSYALVNSPLSSQTKRLTKFSPAFDPTLVNIPIASRAPRSRSRNRAMSRLPGLETKKSSLSQVMTSDLIEYPVPSPVVAIQEIIKPTSSTCVIETPKAPIQNQEIYRFPVPPSTSPVTSKAAATSEQRTTLFSRRRFATSSIVNNGLDIENPLGIFLSCTEVAVEEPVARLKREHPEFEIWATRSEYERVILGPLSPTSPFPIYVQEVPPADDDRQDQLRKVRRERAESDKSREERRKRKWYEQIEVALVRVREVERKTEMGTKVIER